MMKKMILVRGASGSGKSTLANKLFEEYDLQTNCCIFEADNWFCDVEGNYVFDAKELGNAHRWCQLSVEYFFKSMVFDGVAIVSNTSTTYKEILPYALLADKYGCEIEIMEPSTPWKNNPEECHKRNSHNVPLDTIRAQIDRLSKHPIKCGMYDAKTLIEILGQ